jgi:hypothetical protein
MIWLRNAINLDKIIRLENLTARRHRSDSLHCRGDPPFIGVALGVVAACKHVVVGGRIVE